MEQNTSEQMLMALNSIEYVYSRPMSNKLIKNNGLSEIDKIPYFTHQYIQLIFLKS